MTFAVDEHAQLDVGFNRLRGKVPGTEECEESASRSAVAT